MNQIELATLAGFFAGEGSITITSGKWPTLYAALGNSEKLWTEKFYTLFGGSFYLEQPKYNGAKFMFRWRVCGKKAVEFLKVIQPFLIGEKAEQLKLGLEFQALKEACTTPKLKSYPPEVLLEMKRLHTSMCSLRRTAAETNRRDASPWRSDSPILKETSDTEAVR